MKKVKIEDFVEEIKRKYRVELYRLGDCCCPHCGKKMINVENPTTGKKSKYMFKCDCKDWPKGIILGMG